jgi:hypothetical protein
MVWDRSLLLRPARGLRADETAAATAAAPVVVVPCGTAPR